MNKAFVFRIGECIFDLTLVAYDIIETYDLDVDSREVYNEVFRLAIEFEGIFDEDSMDYMTEIEEFGYKKFAEYFNINTKEHDEEHEYTVTICYKDDQTLGVRAKNPGEAVKEVRDKLGINDPITYIVKDKNGCVVDDGWF